MLVRVVLILAMAGWASAQTAGGSSAQPSEPQRVRATANSAQQAQQQPLPGASKQTARIKMPAVVPPTTPAAKPEAAPVSGKPRPVVRRAAAVEKVPGSTAPVVSVEAKGKVLKGTGQRDPFLSIISTEPPKGPGCSTGKQCLAIEQLVVRGVAKHPGGMVALVENEMHRSYFLRVNDSVFNGEVVGITGDSVVFREKVIDRIGRVHTREVVKRVGARPTV